MSLTACLYLTTAEVEERKRAITSNVLPLPARKEGGADFLLRRSVVEQTPELAWLLVRDERQILSTDELALFDMARLLNDDRIDMFIGARFDYSQHPTWMRMSGEVLAAGLLSVGHRRNWGSRGKKGWGGAAVSTTVTANMLKGGATAE